MKKDTLCVDASENRIVIGGLTSQKVWVFNVKEKAITKRATMDIIKCTVTNTR